MGKKLENVVEVVFKGLNRALSNEYEHIYVIDTNIIHGFPEALKILAQEDRELKKEEKPNIIILSDVVRRELNGIKKSDNIEKALDARFALKGIHEILSSYKAIKEDGYPIGIEFKNGSLLFLVPYSEELDNFPKLRRSFGGDDQILSTALFLREKVGKDHRGKVSIVSDDEDMHTSCFQFGIPSSKFEEFYKDDDYTGFVEINIQDLEDFKLYEKIRKGEDLSVEIIEKLTEEVIYPNQFIRFFGHQIDNKKAFRVDPRKEKASRKLRNYENFKRYQYKCGIKTGYVPTWEQECALELLCDPAIDYVTLSGPPGGGKTMLPLDVGLTLLKQDKIFSVIVSNPPIRSTLGYFPGTKIEKLTQENQNIFDALYFLLGMNEGSNKNKEEVEKELEEMILKGAIELETLTYVKGRTLSKRLILFDEAEDYEPKHMRKLASRLGQNSKMVFSGDPHQIDNPRCSRTRNGLVYFISKFKGQPNYGHITIEKEVMRSYGAEQSAKLL